MSKKGKLILATAVFGAALFGASCGGGGETASAPPPPPPPPPGVEGQVLALLEVGTVSAGTLKPVTICQLKSDNKAYCENDLNPTANVDLYYGYEFGNGNVLLMDAGWIGYFFDGSQVIRLDGFRPLGASSATPKTPAPGGITIPNPTASGTKVYVTPNFVILLTNSDKDLVVVTRSGEVIKDSNTSAMSVNASCEAVKKGGTDFKLNTDGTSTSTTIPTTLASAGGKSLVRDGSNIYLSDSRCSASGVLVATTNANDARMVKVGDDFFIAMRVGGNLHYYKVSGDTPTPLNTSITLAGGANEYFYALDGMGRLYARTAGNTVSVYSNISGLPIGSVTVGGLQTLLGFEDRALARGSNVWEITTTGSTVNALDKGGGALLTALDRCTEHGRTRAINGEGTNFIRCVYEHGSTRVLYSLTFDSGAYGNASYNLPAAFNDVLWAPNKALIEAGGTIYLCNTPPGSSISCSATDLPDLDTGIKHYLKANFSTNDVFYTTSGGNLKVGNIFDPPGLLPITVSEPSGGNASLDLNKFAFSFRPAGAPCATGITYLSSRTASPRTYTIAQPSNACVARILKTFP